MGTVNERYVLCKLPASGIVKGTHDNRRYPVKLAGVDSNTDKVNPVIALLASADNGDVLYGELLDIDDGEARVQTGGIITVRANAAPGANQVGRRAIGGGANNQVGPAANLTAGGKGRIVGNDTENIDGTDRNVFHIDLDA